MGVSTPASTMFPITPLHQRSESIDLALARPVIKTRPGKRTMEANHTYELYPLPLKHVRALFLHDQYRQCILGCRQLLLAEPDMKEHAPLHYTFVVFYLAMAYEQQARKMENTSPVKISTFNQAEQFYRDAMSALPSGEAAQILARDHFFAHDGLNDDVSDMQLSYTPASPAADIMLQDFAKPDSHLVESPPSPPTHIYDNTPEHSDNESQGSFEDIMTPNRMMSREFSRRSLIASPTKALAHSRPRSFCGDDKLSLPRTTSNMSIFQTSTKHDLTRTTSQRLLRPVRLGSPAKPYTEMQPILPTHTTSGIQRTRLPRAISPPRAQKTQPVCQTIDEEEDPISPLGPEDLTRASTLSPVSSISSFDDTRMQSPIGDEEEQHYIDREFLSHLEAMHTQIESHLRMLNKARDETFRYQSATKEATPEDGEDDPTSPAPLPISQTRHIHALESKAANKRRRLIAGRERRWTRERFDPTRYQELAEKALAEL